MMVMMGRMKTRRMVMTWCRSSSSTLNAKPKSMHLKTPLQINRLQI